MREIPAWKNMRTIKTTVQNTSLKGLSYEIDFENVDENLHILALIRAAAGTSDF
jgi:hypothetical protein